MNDRILEKYNEVLTEMYTSLVIRNGNLYERYYPSYEKPDYTLIFSNLTLEEIDYAENLGIINRNKQL